MAVPATTVLFCEDDEATLFSFVTSRRPKTVAPLGRPDLAVVASKMAEGIEAEDLACD